MHELHFENFFLPKKYILENMLLKCRLVPIELRFIHEKRTLLFCCSLFSFFSFEKEGEEGGAGEYDPSLLGKRAKWIKS